MIRTNRRHFLYSGIGLYGIAALGLFERHLFANEDCKKTKTAPELETVSKSLNAFGINMVLTVKHQKKNIAEKAIFSTIDELKIIENILSLYIPDSQVCRLNNEGLINSPHPYLVSILKKAEEISLASDGAFDVSVQPLWELYAWVGKTGKIPGTASIESVKKKINWRRIEITPDKIQFLEKGMAVTFNGIAQGFAADCALSILKMHGIEHACVDTGEIGTIGNQDVSTPWIIGIEDPRKPSVLLSEIPLKDRCVSTSGDYETSFSPDFAYNHIFDPQTGRSPVSFSSVTVIASTGILADALSTALFVLGYEKGIRVLESYAGCEALFVDKEGKRTASPGFPKLL